jgi:TolB-like protein
VVNAFAVHAGITRETATALNLLYAVGETWMTDFDFTGPKALLVGDLLQLDGRADLARLQYEAALTEIRRRQEADPTDIRLRRPEVWVQLGLGHRDEARAALRIVSQSLPRPARWSLRNTWWSGTIRACLLLDERALALALLKEGCEEPQGRLLLRTMFRLDPRMAPFRDDKEIAALLAEPKSETGGAASATPAVDAKSVAVLAFANLSDDKANEYFSDGISEELLNVLAKISGLKVTARTSSFHFKGKDTPIPEIARQLGVAYIVEGSVRKAGTQVRITAQLIKAADGFHMWSDTFTRDLKDIFAVQDEIAGLIAQNLQMKLGMKSAPRVVNPEAYALFLQGRAIINRGVPDDHAKGIQCFKDSLALDGGSALTWAWLATSYGTAAAQNTMPAAPAWALAREAANRALALDPELVEGHYALGSLQFLADWDWARANESLQHALLLAPGDANTLGQASNLAAALGQGERAVELGRQAVALDPLNYFPAFVLGKAYFRTGRYAEMEKLAEQMIAVNPAGRFGPFFLAFARLLQGRVAPAAQTAEQMEPGAFQLMCLALVRHAQGRGAESDAALNELKARDVQSRGYLIAEVYANRGEADQAFQWLENSYRTRDSGLTWLVGDPFMQSLHGDARWSALMKKMKLPDGGTK